MRSYALNGMVDRRGGLADLCRSKRADADPSIITDALALNRGFIVKTREPLVDGDPAEFASKSLDLRRVRSPHRSEILTRAKRERSFLEWAIVMRLRRG